MKGNNVAFLFVAIVAGISLGFICLHYLCGAHTTEQLPEQHIYELENGLEIGMCKPGDPE